LICLLLGSTANAALYASWDRYEADKLAAAWLIKRFVDPAAEFRFLPAGTPLPHEAIPFDVPGVPLGRSIRRTTFTAVYRHYRLADPTLERIGLFINDLELNVWEDKEYPESQAIADMVASVVGKRDPATILTISFDFFDKLYNDLSRVRQSAPAMR